MFKKICCTFLCVLLVLSLCACSRSPVIATYEGMSLNSSMYALHLAIEKKAIQEAFYQYGMDISSTPAFWDEYYNEEEKITWMDYIETEFCNILIAMKFCKEHNITITDESIAAEIDSLVSDYVDMAGSKDLLNIELANYGADYGMLVEYLRSFQYISLMQEYLAEDGTITVSDAEILEYLADYWNYDYILFETVDQSGNSLVDEDITDEMANQHFLENYVTVKHVLYLTSNSTDEEKAEKKATAEKNLASIQAGEATLDDFKKDNEDSGSKYTFTYGKMVAAFEEAAFDMEVGEVRLVETEYGYHLMEKQELDTASFDNMKSEVKAAATAARIGEKAEALFEKVKEDDSAFVKSENDEYTYYEGMAIHHEDDSLGKDLYEKFKATEIGDYFIHKYGTYGYFIFKRVEFDDDDITNRGEQITETLIAEKFTAYIGELAKSVEVNTEEMSKFDIKTVRPFFDEE